MRYLMLNKDDITEVCGCIEKDEAINELNLSESSFCNFLDQAKVFREKYILVEDIDMSKVRKRSFETRMFYESESGKRYYAQSDGYIFVKTKSGKKKYLKGYINKSKNLLQVHIANKQIVVKNLIASLFINEYKRGDTVLIKSNNIRDVSVDNLIVVDKSDYARMTGPMSRSRKVGLYENDKLIRTYRSAREAGRKLYCSYQMISDICNDKYNKKEFDVRWI